MVGLVGKTNLKNVKFAHLDTVMELESFLKNYI